MQKNVAANQHPPNPMFGRATATKDRFAGQPCICQLCFTFPPKSRLPFCQVKLQTFCTRSICLTKPSVPCQISNVQLCCQSTDKFSHRVWRKPSEKFQCLFSNNRGVNQLTGSAGSGALGWVVCGFRFCRATRVEGAAVRALHPDHVKELATLL